MTFERRTIHKYLSTTNIFQLNIPDGGVSFVREHGRRLSALKLNLRAGQKKNRHAFTRREFDYQPRGLARHRN